jgi:hypothetical protein
MGSGRQTNSETREAYVIDNGCVRKNARDDPLEAARTHTKECALMGYCVESGYSLVNEADEAVMLDAAATPNVVRAIEESDHEEVSDFVSSESARTTRWEPSLSRKSRRERRPKRDCNV